MSQLTYPIQGIPVDTGRLEPPTRKEITAWLSDTANAHQVSLFMRALTEFQQLSPTNDSLSYYRIAGIHGEPDVEWDGVGNPPGSGFAGWWCAHNKETFATWHRPYLALFEQRIYEIMRKIIERDVPAPQVSIWEEAAKEWRLPYWDWGARQKYLNDYGLPEILTKERIDIINLIHDSPPVNIVNPLWKFTNPTGEAMGHRSMGRFRLQGIPWNRARATSRWGIALNQDESTWTDGVNDWEEANEAIRTPSLIGWLPTSIADAVYRLFATTFSSWESFESKKFHNPPTSADYLSLEFVHDGIHSMTGGFERLGRGIGHMADPSVAAFDPIFWLHHCNVDRLATIFQALHENMWFDSASGVGDVPLDPFHRDASNTPWTSNSCRDWKASFKYDYDDFTVPGQPAGVAPRSSTLRSSSGDAPRDDERDLPTLKKRINEKYGVVRREIMNSPSMRGRENDYVINIVYDRYALDGAAYFIHFFLGAPPGEVSFFRHANSYIGSVYTFSSSLEERGRTVQCHSCLEQKKQGVLSTAQIPITNVILGCAKDSSRTSLHSMTPDEVESYLEKNLTWRAVIAIEDPGDPLSAGLIDMTRIPRTKIYAMKGTVSHSENDFELSTYSDYTSMWRATAGKPGGAVRENG